MKLIFVLIAILQSCTYVYSQRVKIAAFQSELFVGLENELHVQTRIKHDSLTYSSTNGKVERTEEGGI
jgi:hypothetical protein